MTFCRPVPSVTVVNPTKLRALKNGEDSLKNWVKFVILITHYATRRNSPGKNTEVGCHSLLQGIFLTQRLNPYLLHCRQSPTLQAGSLPQPPGKHIFLNQIRSDQSLSHVWLFATPYEPQHAKPPCPSPPPRVYSDSRPSSQWCHPDISSSVFQWVNSSHEVAKVLEFQL